MRHAVAAICMCLISMASLSSPCRAQLDDCNFNCAGSDYYTCYYIHVTHSQQDGCGNYSLPSVSGGTQVNRLGTCYIDQGKTEGFPRPFWGDLSATTAGVSISSHFTCSNNSSGYDVSLWCDGGGAYGDFGSRGASCHTASGASDSYSCSGSLLQRVSCPPKGMGNCMTSTSGGQP